MNMREMPMRGSDAEREIHPDVEWLHTEAAAFLERNSIHPDEFRDLYDPAMIAADMRKVENRKRTWKENDPMKAYADALEYLVYRQIKENALFGTDDDVIKTSEYDDVMNGTDLVVEFGQTEANTVDRLGLAIDVTFGSETLAKKFDLIKEQIGEGELGSIKYFISEKYGIRGQLTKIPRVVIGIEKRRVEEAASLLRGGKADIFSNHPMIKAFLHEASVQLRTYAQYAEKVGQADAAKVYRRELSIIQSVTNERFGVGMMDLDDIRDDRVLQSIRTALGEKF